MAKSLAEIKEQFREYLHYGEKSHWVGQAHSNIWTLGSAVWILLATFFYVMLIIVFGIMVNLVLKLDTITQVIVAFVVLVYVVALYLGRHRLFNRNRNHGFSRFFLRNSYAITNLRLLICDYSVYRDAVVHACSLLEIDNIALSKAKNGLSDISVYSKGTVNKKLGKPIFQLKGIAEEEAQAAYEILRQAREEALEDRAREMGIE